MRSVASPSSIRSKKYWGSRAEGERSATPQTPCPVDYTYDDLYRLIQEDIADPVSGPETIAYTYDAFGNRLSKADGSGMIVYDYDANDRLVGETGPSGSIVYTYDANGNTLTKSEDAGIARYGYDFENRLIFAQTPAGHLSYA